MAINSTTGGINVTRSTSPLDPTANWTRSLWIRNGSTTPTGGNYRTYWFFGDVVAPSINPYLYLGGVLDTNKLYFEYWDGSSYFDTTAVFTMVAGTYYYATITYNATTHDIKLYIDSVLIDTINVNISLVPFVETDELIGPDTWGDVSFSLERIWQRILTVPQMQEEMGSLTPKLNTNLISATGLQTITDLDDQFGNDWTLNGVATTFSGPAILTFTQRFVGVLNGLLNWVPTNAAGTVVIKRCSGSGCSVANVATGIDSTLGQWVDSTVTEGGVFRYQIEITVAGQGVWLSQVYTVTWGVSQTPIVYDIPGLAGSTVVVGTLAPSSGSKTLLLGTIVDDSQVPTWAECIRIFLNFRFYTSAGVYHPQTGWFVFNFDTAIDYLANLPTLNAAPIFPGSGSGWYDYSGISLSQFGQGGGLTDNHVYQDGSIHSSDSRYANWNPLNAGGGPTYGSVWSRANIFAYQFGVAFVVYNQNFLFPLTILDAIVDYYTATIRYVSPATYFISASSTGTITVNKVVIPTNPTPTFALQINGSLSPATFSLQDGDSQAFASVPVGSGYEVTETADPDYTTTIEVSNGSPSDNISVGVGEDVIVTVTNSSRVSGSGLHKLVLSAVNPPPKTDDCYLDEDGNEVCVKIPWFAETGLLLPEE